ncbi:MAG: sulfatase-like hydrolase/transferase, partial [Spirochaetia bacterium]|nr:sulfatase-like hydrolase/transferase [Spirochaetia bacterium]
MKRPNIVIFNPDSWRGEAAGYSGNKIIRTPHLDALAAEGTGFTNAFAQSPVCVPSRCSFMTGWYPHVRGHRTMHHMLSPEEPELLKELKNSGYQVWWGGKNDMVRLEDEKNHCHIRFDAPEDHRGEFYSKVRKPGSKHFYTHYEGKLPYEYAYFRDDGNVDGAVEFLKSKPTEPFCLVLTLSLPHCP